jgi:predicted N-acetyltransferase YhbS
VENDAMTIRMRTYRNPEDFKIIGDFLIQHYQPGNRDGNWFQPIWEYAHSHPLLDETGLEKIGIWEDSSGIVGVIHYESKLGEAFFEIRPGFTHLKPEMLDYAEKHLNGTNPAGKRFLRVYVNDFDAEFEALVQKRGYQRAVDYDRPMSQFSIPEPFPEIKLPDGFRLKSLQDENNITKIQRVMWRGFNHPGEPPENEIDGQWRMQSGPNFRKDINMVVEAPQGSFVAYCGMWYDPINQIAYVEPVATDPDFRRMGLGKAAVLEGIRRCGVLGATVAYVGSDLEFYRAIGFKKIFTSNCWVKSMTKLSIEIKNSNGSKDAHSNFVWKDSPVDQAGYRRPGEVRQ